MNKKYNFTLDSISFSNFNIFFNLLKLKKSDSIFDLEKWFTNNFNNSYSVATPSGRFGLFSILHYLRNNQKNKNVIISGFSCVVVSNSVRASGCIVKYADINKSNLLISYDSLIKNIDINTIAIVFQHIFGQIEEDLIEKIRENYPDITIIEDCAHSLGGYYKNDNRLIGSKGDYAFFSFEQSKIITSWTGGMVIGKSKLAIDHIRLMHSKCKKSTYFDNIKLFIKITLFYFGFSFFSNKIFQIFTRVILKIFRIRPSMTFNERNGIFKPFDSKKYTNNQALLILEQLNQLDVNISHRKKITDIYSLNLKSTYLFSKDTAVLRFPLFVKNKKLLISNCLKYGIVLGDWFSTPLHPSNPELQIFNYLKNSCPVSEETSNHLINLPTSLKISEKDALYIVDILNNLEY